MLVDVFPCSIIGEAAILSSSVHSRMLDFGRGFRCMNQALLTSKLSPLSDLQGIDPGARRRPTIHGNVGGILG